MSPRCPQPLLVGALVLAGCAPAAPPPANSDAAPWFDEVAAEVGLDFVHVSGKTGALYFCEMMGSGAALFDYDGDGDLDAYLVQGGPLGRAEGTGTSPGDRLYRNDLELSDGGQRRLRFTDVTEASGIDARGYGMGVATGDYDNDGDVDLYLTNWGPNQLWRNDGEGRFTDVTAVSGTDDPRWSVSAAFVDYDRDGWLDLYVGNYVAYTLANHKECFLAGRRDYCSPASYAPVPDRLFRNRGDGTFEDVTARSGLARAYGPALGVVTADLDGDGWIDLYVANDGAPNQLWVNAGDGTFRDTALVAGCALNETGEAEASMGLDAADFDGDSDFDLFMTHLDGETNTFYVNDGDARFEDRTVLTGLGPPSRPMTGFGTAALDYDGDGWLDLLVVNGAVTLNDALMAAGDPQPLRQSNQLFRNLGAGRFAEVTRQAGPAFALSAVGRGLAVGDVDLDGDVDALISNNDGPARLLLNRVADGRHWIGLRLVGASEPREMLGAQVTLLRDGHAPLLRRAGSDGSYASARDPRVVIGLETDTPADAQVRWPDGTVEAWDALPVDRWHTLVSGTGRRPAAR